MKKKNNNSRCASAVQVWVISLSAVFLTLGAAPARNQFERKPVGTSVAVQNPHDRATASELLDRSWVPTGSMITARELHTATLLQSGKVLVAGGDNRGYLSSAELYDPSSGTWSDTGSMGTARYSDTATLLPSGKVLVAGGSSDGIHILSSAEVYDPATGTWTATGSMNFARLITRRPYCRQARCWWPGALMPLT